MMRNVPGEEKLILERIAHGIFDSLAHHGVTSEKNRGPFLHSFVEEGGKVREHRLTGSTLGFGCKFRSDRCEWKITYYSEDKSDDREAKREAVNNSLKKLKKQLLS